MLRFGFEKKISISTTRRNFNSAGTHSIYPHAFILLAVVSLPAASQSPPLDVCTPLLNPRFPGPLFSWLGTSEPSRPLDRPTDASFRRTSSCPMLILSLPISNGAPATEELSPALSHGNRELLWEPVPISRFPPRLNALPVGKEPTEAWRACPGSLTKSVRYPSIRANIIPLTISGA